MAAIRGRQLFAHYWKRPARPVAEGIPALPRRARRNSSALSLVSPRTSGEDSIRRRHLTFTPAGDLICSPKPMAKRQLDLPPISRPATEFSRRIAGVANLLNRRFLEPQAALSGSLLFAGAA